jgi:ferredoxin
MADEAMNLFDLKGEFRNTVKDLLSEGIPELCVDCDACAKVCPAAGVENMDPRKLVRMIALGEDEAVTTTDWVWMCSMCQGCVNACPVKADIPQMVGLVRRLWPRENVPKGILGSCDMALKHDTCSAMGVRKKDFQDLVEEILEEVRDDQPGWEDLQAPINKKGAVFFLNQNSREPVIEPDEMVPLWKILHLVGADWTYGTKGWAAENYCMFMEDWDAWEHIVRTKAQAVDKLGCQVWLNTE